jgi:hypothetical protein
VFIDGTEVDGVNAGTGGRELDGGEQAGVSRKVLVRGEQVGVAGNERVSHARRDRVLTCGVLDAEDGAVPAGAQLVAVHVVAIVGVWVRVQAAGVASPRPAARRWGGVDGGRGRRVRVARIPDVQFEGVDAVGHVVLDANGHLVRRARRHRRGVVDRVARTATVGDVGVDVEVGGVAVPRECVVVSEGLTVTPPIWRAEYHQQHGRHQTGCGQEPYCCASLRCSCHVGLPS